MTLEEILEKTVVERPDELAIIFKGGNLTYAHLLEKINMFACTLSKLAVGPGERVAILSENFPMFIIAFLAVIKVGAAVVPLDTRYKEGELRFILTDSQTKTLFTSDRYLKKAERVIPSLNGFKNLLVGEPPEGIPFQGIMRNVDEEAEALYIYTSGSTGHPKGIIRSRRNLVSEAENVVTTEKITSNDRILGVLPLFHSYGLGHCLLASIWAGASLVLLDRFNPHEIIDVIKETGVTVFPGVPYMYDLLVNTYLKGPPKLSSLRLCISAGAPLSIDLAGHFRQRFGLIINQHYGSSEAGAISININKDVEKNVASVGQAMANVDIKIVDDKGGKLEDGRVGEIVVKSPAVAKAYHKSPGLTSKAFKNGWFYTGDLGKKDKDGYLYITGRKKKMINVAGLKVEPTEVEETLKGFHKIKEAVVIGVRDESMGEFVKAVVVPKEDCSEAEIITFCQTRLADYKVPRQIEFREGLPKSATGKILRGEIV